jgi:hypothetical protein
MIKDKEKEIIRFNRNSTLFWFGIFALDVISFYLIPISYQSSLLGFILVIIEAVACVMGLVNLFLWLNKCPITLLEVFSYR